MSHFHVCWSVDTRGFVFSVDSCKKTTMADFRYKSLKPWKIDNIDLTQLLSLSILTDFRYQSIKITWLLSIFIDWLLRVFRDCLSILTDFRYQSIKITWLLSIFIDWLLRVFRDCPGEIGHFAWEDFFFYASSTVVQGDCYLLV